MEVLLALRGTLNVANLEAVYEDDTHVHLVRAFRATLCLQVCICWCRRTTRTCIWWVIFAELLRCIKPNCCGCMYEDDIDVHLVRVSNPTMPWLQAHICKCKSFSRCGLKQPA